MNLNTADGRAPTKGGGQTYYRIFAVNIQEAKVSA